MEEPYEITLKFYCDKCHHPIVCSIFEDDEKEFEEVKCPSCARKKHVRILVRYCIITNLAEEEWPE